jgi:hypothetical protein
MMVTPTARAGSDRAKLTRPERGLLVISLLGGILLTVIGMRYFLIPERAARSFGVAGSPVGHEFHSIIGLRNVWLGLLAVGLALWRQWRALALWFALGAPVCFGDAFIAASSLGRPPQIAFHLSCGFCCVALAGVIWWRQRLK